MNDHRLLSTVGELYEAATDPARLGALGTALQSAMEVESCIVFTARHGTGQLVQLVSASPNFDERARADYRAYYHMRNPWYQSVANREPPFVARGGEMIGYREFDRTEFCADWCSRVGIYHMIGGFTPVRPGIVAACGVHAPRSRGPFDEGRKRLFAQVMRHLGRAFQIADRLGLLFSQQSLTLQLLERLRVGVILVDAGCAPLFVNPAAERLVGASRWLRMRVDRISPVHPGCVAELERRVAAAAATSAAEGLASGGVVSLRDPLEGELPLLVAPFRSAQCSFAALPPAAALIFLDPDGPATPAALDIAAAYRLTRAEGRLVAALARGRNLVQVARENGISPNTAKTQLRSVFLKTGFQRQGDLVAAVLAHPVLRLTVPAG
jgi:DNA-binding CsgD family transcriptional regulator/PAS domain-containing protein